MEYLTLTVLLVNAFLLSASWGMRTTLRYMERQLDSLMKCTMLQSVHMESTRLTLWPDKGEEFWENDKLMLKKAQATARKKREDGSES